MNFEESPMFRGWAAPFRAELSSQDLEVEGELPADLVGSFYRVQPDFLYPPTHANDVPFNGDGHVSLFRFTPGHVDFRCRYVRTQRFKAQQAARKALFGTYRNRFTDDPSVEHLSGGTANTNLIYHAGRLFAMKEDSPPVQIDPHTLETLDDYYTFDGKLQSLTFTAHPKIDPITGEMVGFGYEARGNGTDDVAFYGTDASGKVNWEAWIKVPYVGMLHDFALTTNHVALLVIPYTADLERMRQGHIHFAWDSSLPTWLGVMRRGGDGSDLRWYKGPLRCATHVMNAYEVGSQLFIDMDMAPGSQFPFVPSLHEVFDPTEAHGRITRLKVDLAEPAETYEMEVMYGEVCVLPRIDERYWSLPYNVGFAPVMDFTKPLDGARLSVTGLVINTWARFDHDQRKVTTYSCDNVSSLQECCFVPRSRTAREGAGYLIGIVNRYLEDRCDLLVLDAEHLDAGPLATVRLPHRLRNGIHTHWVPDWVLPVR